MTPRPRLTIALIFLMLLLTPAANAHIGSKDVFQTVQAGPYTLNVTIRPPTVVPGIATVEIRSSGAPITSLRITPLPLTGEASRHPPASDPMHPSPADPAFFTGGVWLMASGTWQVRIEVEGAAGPQTASIPVLAVPLSTLKMQPGLGLALSALALFLILSMAGVVAAASREARLAPGLTPAPAARRRALLATAASLVLMALILFGGARWWNVEAASYAGNISAYAPGKATATLTGNQLDFILDRRPGPPNPQPLPPAEEFLPDHGKLIHLYAIRFPAMDAAFHLHPTLAASGDFRMTLPAMPPGTYRLFGDVVHHFGFPETLTSTLTIPPGLPAAPLAEDDASAAPPPLSPTPLDPSYKLPDGYTMLWDRPATLTAGTAYAFHFRLLDPLGHPAPDTVPYLGMAGHAAFVKTDASVFAHTHPDGSAPMPDLMLANPAAAMPMATPTTVPPEVTFPYGFPTPGRYRLFIQMKHNATVETGVFDATVQ